jgi:hypothetical protein
MVDRDTAPFYFTQPLATSFKLHEDAAFTSGIRRMYHEHIKWMDKQNWNDQSSYLEKLAMLMSEVWEVYSKPLDTVDDVELYHGRTLEFADIILRTFSMIDVLKRDTDGEFNIESVLMADTVIDNRFESLASLKEGFFIEDWLFCLYNKIASMVNGFRSYTLDANTMDLNASLNQIIYMSLMCITILGRIRENIELLRNDYEPSSDLTEAISVKDRETCLGCILVKVALNSRKTSLRDK